ncbi:MAG: hypothetical protein F4139_04120 [Gemmatimonadetes bacterium]|nr:hypothetical protein [Gemmatimonadota bacterium]MYA63465.1 hypothetical protein [Gemmatimonadota bacterium]MYB98948.1 hypothetical protein [Gemmatimonadota bacterium]MYH52122.1 hypothetical protein [Gemmatimonadota bacterium]MYI45440.1 hypothetical protein [Gemmatimonadota bacterium]
MATGRRFRVPVAVTAVGALILSPVAGPADELSGAQRGPPPETAQIVARIGSEPLLTIGNKPEDALFRVVGVALVEDALIVAEWSSRTLRYYDRATGELLQTIGGEGEGPGEYEFLTSFRVVGDRLYTFDPGNRRLTVLDRTGAVEKTVTIQPWGGYPYPDVAGIFTDGSMLVASSRQPPIGVEGPTVMRVPRILARYDSTGSFVDSLGHYLGGEGLVVPYGRSGSGTRRWPGPFNRAAYAAVLGDEYYIRDNMEFAIPFFDQTGKLVRELGSGASPEPRAVTRKDHDRFGELDGAEGWERPEFYPYHGGISELNGLIWVRQYHWWESPGERWALYSTDGERVGEVESSENLFVAAADDDVVAILRYNELDVEIVELRRLVGWR